MSVTQTIRVYCWGKDCGRLDVDELLAITEQAEATARADILQLCQMLAGVQCINTVQEVRNLRTVTRTIQARWGIKEVQL